MPWLDTLVSIHSSAKRSALSQCGAVMIHAIPLHRCFPQLLLSMVRHPGLRVDIIASTNLAKAGTYSL